MAEAETGQGDEEMSPRELRRATVSAWAVLAASVIVLIGSVAYALAQFGILRDLGVMR